MGVALAAYIAVPIPWWVLLAAGIALAVALAVLVIWLVKTQ